MAIELDYFEVSTDAGMQSRYVSNDATVDQENTTVGGAWALSGTTNPRYHEAQSFILSGAKTVSAVEVKSGNSAGTPTGNWSIRIETDSGGLPSGTLADANATATVVTPVANTVYKAVFTTPFALSASTTYWLVINCDDQDGSNQWTLQSNTGTSTYASGGIGYWTAGGWVDTYVATWDLYFKIYTESLQSYSESTIKTQGSYSLKAIASTSSLNKTLTRTVDPTIDLSSQTKWKFDIRSNRTGSNVKIGIHDSGGTTTETTPNITSADTFQTVSVDISGVADADKNAIDSIILTQADATSATTYYIDNMYGTIPIDWIPKVYFIT